MQQSPIRDWNDPFDAEDEAETILGDSPAAPVDQESGNKIDMADIAPDNDNNAQLTAEEPAKKRDASTQVYNGQLWYQ